MSSLIRSTTGQYLLGQRHAQVVTFTVCRVAYSLGLSVEPVNKAPGPFLAKGLRCPFDGGVISPVHRNRWIVSVRNATVDWQRHERARRGVALPGEVEDSADRAQAVDLVAVLISSMSPGSFT